MNEAMGTGDLIIVILAALGVVVLIGVFFVVVRMVFFSKDQE